MNSRSWTGTAIERSDREVPVTAVAILGDHMEQSRAPQIRTIRGGSLPERQPSSETPVAVSVTVDPTLAAATAQSQPTGGAPRGLTRMVGIDFARFLAIVGMMCAHLLHHDNPGFVLWDGNPSILFAVIGGISVILATRRYLSRGEVTAARWAMAARGIIVIAVGMGLALLNPHVYIVLVYFGAAMLASIPFIRAKNSTLLVCAAVLAVVGPLLSGFVRASVLPVDDLNNLGLGFADFADPVGLVRMALFTGYYPVINWIVYLLVGMVVGRHVLSAQRNGTESTLILRFIAIGASMVVVAITVSEISRRAFATPALLARGLNDQQIEGLLTAGIDHEIGHTDWWFYLLNIAHSGLTLDIVRGIGFSLLVIGSMLWLAQALSPRTLRLLRPMSSAGTAPLTIYSLHVAAVALIPALYVAQVKAQFPDGIVPTGFVISELPWWVDSVWLLLLQIGLALILGLILAVTRRRGPLEAIVSTLANRVGKLAAQRSSRVAAAPAATPRPEGGSATSTDTVDTAAPR